MSKRFVWFREEDIPESARVIDWRGTTVLCCGETETWYQYLVDMKELEEKLKEKKDEEI